MSFGFAIGDLANKLYEDVCMVARPAPEDLKALLSGLSVLSQSINLLVEGANNPESTLAKAGDSRVKMVREMMT
jgi:hypothetical protein